VAEIRNHTLNFSSGRITRLTFAEQRLASTEIELRRQYIAVVPSVKVV
jgi:hypothetical protein